MPKIPTAQIQPMLPKLDRFVPVRILGNSFEIAGSRDAAAAPKPQRRSHHLNPLSAATRFPDAAVSLMNTLKRHLQHGPRLRAPGVGVMLDRIQQHPHQVDGVVEMLERPADVPGVRPGGIGQLRVGLVLLVVCPSGQIGEVVLALFPDGKNALPEYTDDL